MTDWRAELAKLPTLQEIDLRLDELRRLRTSLMAGEPWADAYRRVIALRRRVVEFEERRSGAERRQRQADLERQSEAAEVARIERLLYGGSVRNPRELEGLQKNLDGAKGRVGDFETSVLEAMEAIEALDQELRPIRAALAETEGAMNQQRRAGARRLAEVDAELAQREGKRSVLAASIDAAVLDEYQRVRACANGIGVARLEGGTCQACGVGVSALVQSRVRKGERAHYCENCGRLLVGG